jgi:formate dehydrogenase gamma subunit
MRRIPLLLALLLTTMSCMALASTEAPQETGFVNYDRFVGRDAVTDKRGLSLKLNRPLPLSCPPFNLRDKDGEIINPIKGEGRNPLVPKYDPETGQLLNPDQLRGVGKPVSTRQTCGMCHPYDEITMGYHFQMGRGQMYNPVPEARKDKEASPVSQSPGFFGKWNIFYQRQLTPWHYDDPQDVDLSPWEWMLECGICHPGGGPAELDRENKPYDEALAADRGGATFFGNGDYVDQSFDKTGVMEADCFICHLEGYEYSVRVQEIKKLNFEFAATAGANLGYIFGSVRNGQEPKVYYNTSKFQPDGKILMHIQRPDDKSCQSCHNISTAQKRGNDWHNNYVQDVHSEQGMECIDCHQGNMGHNFQKGESSSQSVRDDLDGTMLSCEKCHDEAEMGAPEWKEAHDWLPALHLERIDCTGCHITHRPFVPVRAVDTLMGTARGLSLLANEDEFDNYAFGAMWGKLGYLADENLLVPFTPEEIQRAAAFKIAANSPLRENFDPAILPESAFSVATFIEQMGGMSSIDARMLMVLALQETAMKADEGEATCIFRGKGEVFRAGGLMPVRVKLLPKRPGAAVAETPYSFGRSKASGKIAPEHNQLGVFWAFRDENGVLTPLFLSEMEEAWAFLTSEEFKRFSYNANPTKKDKKTEQYLVSPALPARDDALSVLRGKDIAGIIPANELAAYLAQVETAENTLSAAITAKLTAYSRTDRSELAVYDDNNDTFPEANTEDEIALVAWALKLKTERVGNKELFYIKGENAYRVDVTPWMNPYDEAYPARAARFPSMLDMDRIGENEEFMAIQRFEEVTSPGANSWDAPSTSWRPVEIRLARNIAVNIYPIALDSDPALAQLAQRLPWTPGHGVEPVHRALGAGGCTDCHASDAHFFHGAAITDPFQADATPATIPMYKRLGYDAGALKLSAWRESVLKPFSPYVVLFVLFLILLHFVLVGAKGAGPVGEADVLRFRFHERLAHFAALITVVFLAISGFCFLLGKGDPLGPVARCLHTYIGYVGSAGIAVMFLFWVGSMFPAKGDLNWLMKAGGYLGFVKGHLPAGKFNAGQKVLFWLAMSACAVLIVTGVLMGIYRGSHFANQELLYTLHDVAALFMIVLLMAHVYLGAVVVPHSLRAVFGGKVSGKWAKEHHGLWKFKAPADTE